MRTRATDSLLPCSRCGSPITGEVHWAVDQALCAGCYKVAQAATRIRLNNLLLWLNMQKGMSKRCKDYWMRQLDFLTKRRNMK